MGDIAVPLSDSVYYEDPLTLRTFRGLLAEGSDELHRAYLNQDFGLDFTDVERDWYARLADLLDFFDGFPFQDVQAAIAEYEHRVPTILRLASLSPAPASLGEETIYHVVLREVTEIVTHVHMDDRLLRMERLVATAPYAAFTPPERDRLDQMPDMRESLAWARRALRSIAADGWLLITWQVAARHHNLSLH